MSLSSSWLQTLRQLLALLALCSAGLVTESSSSGLSGSLDPFSSMDQADAAP